MGDGMRLAKLLVLAPLLISNPLSAQTDGERVSNLSASQIQKRLENLAKTGMLRRGAKLGPLTVTTSTLTDRHLTTTLRTPAASESELQGLVREWPAALSTWCNEERLRVLIDEKNVTFTVGLVSINGQKLIELSLNSTTCPQLRTKMLEAAALQAAAPALDKRADELIKKSEAILKAIDLANSPQGVMCRSYVGKTPALSSFEAAAVAVPKLVLKDEFETTAQFEKRRRSQEQSLTRKSLVISVPVDRDYIEYDADAEQLEVGSLAFGVSALAETAQTGLAATMVLREEGLEASLLDGGNIAIFLGSIEKVTGSYFARNGLGIAVRVTEVDKTTRAIFDKENASGALGQARIRAAMFPMAEIPPHLGASLKLPAMQAKELKSSLKLAYLVEPRAPFLVTGSIDSFPATFPSAKKVNEKFRFLIADIQCGFVLDKAGKVLEATPTN